MRSISSAFAVSIMIGIRRVAESILRTLQISRPGIFGNIRSRMISAGSSSRALRKPEAPSVAVLKLNPPAFRRWSVIRSITSCSSSMIRILVLDMLNRGVRDAELCRPEPRLSKSDDLFHGHALGELERFVADAAHLDRDMISEMLKRHDGL